jgi:hypothetical protein
VEPNLSKEKPLISKQQHAIIKAASDIYVDRPNADDLAFLARQLVQATLPHSDPGSVETWFREEGSTTLLIRSGYDLKNRAAYGLPYGPIARLLLYWITAEAVRTKSRTLSLGNSLSEFIRELGLTTDTGRGKRGDATRLRNQMLRLFNSAISFGRSITDDEGREGEIRVNMQVASKTSLWWNHKQPENATLWNSEITLGEEFYQSITAAPIPLDMRALRALKKSPLGLDLYAWCAYNAYRAQQTGKSRWIPWPSLAKALGADYGRTKNFQQKAARELRKIQALYPGLRLGTKRGCLEILAGSSLPILPKPTAKKPED